MFHYVLLLLVVPGLKNTGKFECVPSTPLRKRNPAFFAGEAAHSGKAGFLSHFSHNVRRRWDTPEFMSGDLLRSLPPAPLFHILRQSVRWNLTGDLVNLLIDINAARHLVQTLAPFFPWARG